MQIYLYLCSVVTNLLLNMATLLKNKCFQTHLLIHLFALAHVFTVWFFAAFDWSDEIPLTCLTILMIILVGYLYRFPLDLSAVMALLFCFAAFFMGTKGAEWLAPLAEHCTILPNMLTTFIVTEILGWSTCFIATRQSRS